MRIVIIIVVTHTAAIHRQTHAHVCSHSDIYDQSTFRIAYNACTNGGNIAEVSSSRFVHIYIYMCAIASR